MYPGPRFTRRLIQHPKPQRRQPNIIMSDLGQCSLQNLMEILMDFLLIVLTNLVPVNMASRISRHIWQSSKTINGFSSILTFLHFNIPFICHHLTFQLNVSVSRCQLTKVHQAYDLQLAIHTKCDVNMREYCHAKWWLGLYNLYCMKPKQT